MDKKNQLDRVQPRPLFDKHLLGLLDSAKTLAVSAYSQERTPERNQKLMKKVYEIASSSIQRLRNSIETWPPDKKALMTPQCSLGCDHCCYQWVRATIAEVLAVYEFVQQNYSPDQLAELHVRLLKYREDYLSHSRGTIFPIECPLLLDHKCSVYEARPLICRGMMSSDALACKIGKEDPSAMVLIPVLMPMMDIAGSVRYGLQKGLEESELGGTELVFGLGLLILFEDPTARDRFFAGEKVFEDAVATAVG